MAGKVDKQVRWRPGYTTGGLLATTRDWQYGVVKAGVPPTLAYREAKRHMTQTILITDAIIHLMIMRESNQD